MSQFTISCENLEAMYIEGNKRFITSLVDKYKSQIIRANAKGMKTCTCYFVDEDMNIIHNVVQKLKEIFIDSSFQIVRAYINCGEIIVHWGKAFRADQLTTFGSIKNEPEPPVGSLEPDDDTVCEN